MDSPTFNSLRVSDLYSFESYIFTTGDFFSQPMKNAKIKILTFLKTLSIKSSKILIIE